VRERERERERKEERRISKNRKREGYKNEEHISSIKNEN
jgi:hypothetical protein